MTIRGSRALVLIPGGLNWRDAAACVDEPADMFPDESDVVGNERARAVCGLCPVTEECLLFAFASREPWGVWGGLSTAERREEWYRRYAPDSPHRPRLAGSKRPTSATESA
ncbi:WhiB family transcriptional regulator [Kribbella sp. DT2]|uniref:WhiB family transcriptional regulator n=1 Tax=Kribbella sp. DT2 TaxID=3393427 RepID=UPI003CF7A29F